MKQPFLQAVAASFRPWVQLAKVPLCVPVAGSAGFGYILHTPTLTASLGTVISGVLLLACGAAACNSLQDASIDRLFARTCHRPVATGRLSGIAAARFSGVMVVLGLSALWFSAESRLPLLLGIAAVVLYNGVYTPLKKISIFALIPGGLAGALPPLVGWTAAGGMLSDSRSWLLYALFFLWQIPHYCLVLLSHQKDYRAVQQPALIRLLSEQSVQRIALVWILAFAVVAQALALDRALLDPDSRFVLALMAGILAVFALPLGLRKNPPDYRFLFLLLNGVFFAALVLVVILQLQKFR